MTEACPVCKAEPATVVLSVCGGGKIRVGPKCSRFIEQFVLLMGAEPRRSQRPTLRVVS